MFVDLNLMGLMGKMPSISICCPNFQDDGSRFNLICPQYALVRKSFPCTLTFGRSQKGSGEILRDGQPPQPFRWPGTIAEAFKDTKAQLCIYAAAVFDLAE